MAVALTLAGVFGAVNLPVSLFPVVSFPRIRVVIDSGNRQVVIVDRGEGRFEPRPVKVGMRGDSYVEIAEGVKAGENVVVSANFLIDAESNLKAALSGFTADAPKETPQPAAEPAIEKKP